MQTLRKKTSPLKYKNETTRFIGDGVCFKAKLIGILEVSEARGDRMCQEALSDLKMAIRAAGEHKQRITINIAIDGLRLRDEKTGDSLYHHPVHKISFIAQDMTDSRAFGYIFGSPDTGHRFFGIKTDKAASQVVIAMRDLFQVVFALKKKEVELAKQNLDKNYLPPSPLFPDKSASGSKNLSHSEKSRHEAKGGVGTTENKSSGTAVADLVDLELELNSLQQGLHQMERITPSDPFGSKDDPFGDSFISYPVSKPILPPPPSSGRERSSRTSDSSSLFSPRTPHTGSVDTNTDSTVGAKNSRKEFSFSRELNSSHEEPSSGDWFTPSAGNSGVFEESLVVAEPTKDEKHEQTKQEILSQFDVFTELDPLELKNPPKKVLNDLVSNLPSQEPLFNTSFNQTAPKSAPANIYTNTASVFTSDPFGEDPFVKEDPFADSDFSRQDPFDTEFASFPNNFNQTEQLHNLLQSSLSKSPKSASLTKQMSLSTSPRTVQFNKQNTFDVQESSSLDMLSEPENAPEPPPRPSATLMQIKPPPLPPKKQNDLAVKPPPRPPNMDDLHYEYVDSFHSAGDGFGYGKSTDKGPPLPVPSRKAKFESDFTTPPERPVKQFNLQSSEEDYLTPISFPEKSTSPTVFLPPPSRSGKKHYNTTAQVTVASFLESKPNITTSVAADNLNTSLEGLDITLSQLTLSGLNELATKLNIPPSQLSNMTLVQLTNYLSNCIKSKSSEDTQVEQNNTQNDFSTSFQPDFAANFSNMNEPTSENTYDKYAVFRELQEEIKQTKIDTEPEQIQEEKELLENTVNSNVDLDLQPTKEIINSEDKYAALREIVEIELKQSDQLKEVINDNETVPEKELNEEDIVTKIEVQDNNLLNRESSLSEEPEREIISKNCIIEYTVENNENKLPTPEKSPTKSTKVKSPIPSAVTELIQSNTRLTSGSLSDVLSGSSPEIDNTCSNSEAGKKEAADATGESWAIFDQATIPSESLKEKPNTVQSEEGVSPWSSDSKEFGNGSPTDWTKDSGSGGGGKWHRKRRDKDGWWDTSAEPEPNYYPQNRRSTDSYEEEYYECYERPRRRRPGNWQHGNQPTGGHSSSSRDVSPWEEEPRRRETREGRVGWTRHPRGQSFDRHRERRHTDSWDEEDDYEYDEEHGAKFQWSDRHQGRHCLTGNREHDNDRWGEDRNEERRHRRRSGRESRDPRDRRCCPDWEQSDQSTRYTATRRRDRHDERYYSRDSQESPWEDDYCNEPEESRSATHYVAAKRNWKQRPSSASEVDRKMGDLKARHYLGTGSSDGERERRLKNSRRSRSRDSQYSEPSHRHKTESVPIRNPHRSKQHYAKSVDSDFNDIPTKKTPENDLSNKKTSSMGRKKTKDVPKTEENTAGTFPRKNSSRAKSLFENDFVTPDTQRNEGKFVFKKDYEAVEDLPSARLKSLKQKRQLDKTHISLDSDRHTNVSDRHSNIRESKLSPRYQPKSKSLFEDDFSPTEKTDHVLEDNSISSIKEESDLQEEEEDSFSAENFENAVNGRKKFLAKNRMSGDTNLKKSGSVNIFTRENDPFEDDFFSGTAQEENSSPKVMELRWTEVFEEYNVGKDK